MILSQKIDTPLGIMTACSAENGICLLAYDSRTPESADIRLLEKHFGTTVSVGNNIHLEMLKEQLSEYFQGVRKEFSVRLIPTGTSFQNTVWDQLVKIKYGTTTSYIEQSRSLGIPASVRAVARANAHNKIAILIPCHRVVGSNGSLTGYAGGLEKKEWLLAHERKNSGHVYELSLF